MAHCHLANHAPHDNRHMIFFAVLAALQTRTRTDQTAGVKVEVWSLVYEWAQRSVRPAASRPTSSPQAVYCAYPLQDK